MSKRTERSASVTHSADIAPERQSACLRFFLKKYASIIAIVVVYVLINLVSAIATGFDLVKATLDFPQGFVWFLTNFMPEASSFSHMDRISGALVSTVLDSFAASGVAAVLAFVFALLGSRTVGVGGPVPIIVRAIASIFRNIPIVAWAFLLLYTFKQSEFTGFFALFLQSFGFLMRSFLETIDEIDMGPIEALRASGASYLQVVVCGVIPGCVTQITSWVLYMIETNIRDATLVGMLTGTGIGFVFDLYYKSMRYDTAGLVIVFLAIFTIVLELTSNFVRRRLQSSKQSGRAGKRDGKIRLKFLYNCDYILLVTVVAIVVVSVYAFVQMDYGDANMGQAVSDFLSEVWAMASTPGVDGHFELGEIVEGVFVTLALAVLTTFVGAIVALVFGFVAASNLSNTVVSNVIKAIMSVLRAVPTILWVLVFTVAIGLGAEACVIGMLFHSISYLVKSYSESFEELDEGVLEALKSTGASWWQIALQCVMPEKLNEIISWTFIRFEINFVAAVVVAGMAGSGGVGYQLFLAGQFYFDIHEIGLIVYLCLAISVVLEFISTRLRKRSGVRRA